MAVDADGYRAQLAALMPPGQALPADPESLWYQLLGALAQEFARVDEHAQALLRESDPRRALYLFDEWESGYGLPGDCAPADQSQADRVAALVGRVVGRGGMRAADYIALAEGLGYPGASVEEPREATAEVHTATGHTGAVIGDDMAGQAWESTWRMQLPSGVVRESVINEAVVGDPLRSWGDELVECALRGARPAWLILQIGYLEV